MVLDLPTARNALRDKCLDSLYLLTKGVLGYVDLSEESSIHADLCEFLESYDTWESGDGGVFVFRGSFKSTICSIAFPIWLAIKDRGVRILLASMIDINAMKFLGAIRKQIESNEKLKWLFPELIPKNFTKAKWSDKAACVSRPDSMIHKDSTFEAAGLGTTVTSGHFNWIIEDDTIAPRKDDFTKSYAMPTQMDIEKAIGWHEAAVPLLDRAAFDHRLGVGTRWAYNDMCDHLKKRGASMFERRVVERGEPTFPERLDESGIAKVRKKLSPWFWESQYMLNPASPEDFVFKRNYLQYYKKYTDIPNTATFCAIDPAVGSSKSACDTAIVVISRDEENIYVLDYIKRKSMNPTTILAATQELYDKWKFSILGIETVHFMQWLIPVFGDSTPFTIQKCQPGPKDSKELRIRALTRHFETEHFYIKEGMGEFEEQLFQYQGGNTRGLVDLLDATAWAFHISYPAKPRWDKDARMKPMFEITFEDIMEDLKSQGDAIKPVDAPFLIPVKV